MNAFLIAIGDGLLWALLIFGLIMVALSMGEEALRHLPGALLVMFLIIRALILTGLCVMGRQIEWVWAGFCTVRSNRLQSAGYFFKTLFSIVLCILVVDVIIVFKRGGSINNESFIFTNVLFAYYVLAMLIMVTLQMVFLVVRRFIHTEYVFFWRVLAAHSETVSEIFYKE